MTKSPIQILLFFIAVFLTGNLLSATGKSPVDPDILPALPAKPPAPDSPAKVRVARTKLKQACLTALRKKEGLAPQVSLKTADQITAACECLARNISAGKNVEELTVVSAFYLGSDRYINSADGSHSIYLHEATKLEENCRLKPSYKVSDGIEPRLQHEEKK